MTKNKILSLTCSVKMLFFPNTSTCPIMRFDIQESHSVSSASCS